MPAKHRAQPKAEPTSQAPTLGSALRALVFACAALGCSATTDFSPDAAEQTSAGAPTHAGAAPNPTASGSGAAGESTNCESGTPLLLEQLSNARDLGGTPLLPTGHVACGALFRGPPLTLTAAGCSEAAKLGLRTLIDLRIEGERAAAPDAECVAARRVHAPLPIPYGLAAADYLAVLHETASIALVFHTLGDPNAYPSYFHCTYGRDRTGVVAALWLLALGATREAVMHEYRLSAPSVGAFPDSLDAVLDEIEARGGAESVLSAAGITSDELAVMRAQRFD